MPNFTALNRPRLFAFVSPNLAMAAFLIPVTVYLPGFYAEELGLGLATVGFLFLVSKLSDVVTDPLFGYISDRFPSRWGRRRHWMVMALPLMMFCTYKLFLPGDSASGAYLLIWLVLTYMCWTVILLSHVSWASELSNEYHERSRIQGWLKAAGVIGSLAVLTMPAIIESRGGGKAEAVASIGMFVLIALPLGLLFAVSLVGERPINETVVRPSQSTGGWRRAIQIVATNQPLRLLLIAAFCKTLAASTVGALFIFHMKYVLQLGHIASSMMLVFFAAGLLGIPGWLYLSRRIGKHNTFAVSSLFGIVGVVAFGLAEPGNLTIAAAAVVVLGLNFGVHDILPRSIMSDITDKDNALTGLSRTGLFFGFLLTTIKFASALSVGLVFPLLAWIGFEPGATNTADNISNFRYVFIGLPLVAYITIFYVMRKFPLDEQAQLALRERIDAQS